MEQGVQKKTSSNQSVNLSNKQKLVVVVVDKENKKVIENAKIHIIGDNNVYTTDEMGKTPEIQVELNKDYFNRYIDEVSSKIGFGLVNVLAVKDGYCKHYEMDYCIFPGNSPSIVKIQMCKGKKQFISSNAPDIGYIENILKSYEKFDGEGLKTENMTDYKITIKDENKKPIENVKIVIPEAKLSSNTDNKGICNVKIPFDNTQLTNYPVNKDYGEITVLIYKEGYGSKAVFKAQVNKDNSKNNITVQIKKSNKPKIDFEVIKPNEKWVENLLNSCKE